MHILVGADVDVITPFPSTMLAKAAQWMHCYKTLIFDETGPTTPEEVEAWLRWKLSPPNTISWGIVDKANLTGSKEFPAPLVGIVTYTEDCNANGYLSAASNRRAWGNKLAQPGLIDQGGKIIIDSLWTTMPSLQRLSLGILASNKAAWNLALRLGFRKDGYFKHAVNGKTGQPQDVAHFGLLRPTAEPTQEQ